MGSDINPLTVLSDDLEIKHWFILIGIANGRQPRHDQIFDTAYLIAVGYLGYYEYDDGNSNQLLLTWKGRKEIAWAKKEMNIDG